MPAHTTTRTRFARVKPGASLSTVQAYLPRNYQARVAPDGAIFIYGEDNGGWTLDGYVLPRLQSGMVIATEVDETEGAALRDALDAAQALAFIKYISRKYYGPEARERDTLDLLDELHEFVQYGTFTEEDE